MGKRTSGRKRGIQRGVAKHKIKSKPVDEEGGIISKDESALFLGIPQYKIARLGQSCFDFLRRACEKLFLIPIIRLENGVFVQPDLKIRLIHYSYVVLYLLVTVQKTWATVDAFLTHDLQKETFMCISALLAFYVPIFISAGVELRPKETMDVLNSFQYILSCLRELGLEDLTPFDDISTSLKVIVVIVVTQGIALTGTVACLAFPHMVTLWSSALENWGLIPEGVAPRIVWHLILLPVEYMTYMPPMLIASFAGSILLISIGVLKIYTKEIRRINITDMETRERVERLYISLELFNRILQVWMRFMIAPAIVGVSLAIIIGTFVGIRYTELPIFIYLIFPFAAAALMFIIFWASYDIVVTIRDTEDILGRLWSYETDYLQGMSKAERTKVIKRARAMKVLELPIGEFAEFSLNVPINTWEENLNQVLFLLSL